MKSHEILKYPRVYDDAHHYKKEKVLKNTLHPLEIAVRRLPISLMVIKGEERHLGCCSYTNAIESIQVAPADVRKCCFIDHFPDE